MRYLSLLLTIGCLLCLGSLHPSYAETTDGSSDTNTKAWATFHKLDEELTETYQKMLIEIDSAAAREKFTEAQNAWLKFRQAQGEYVAEGAPDKATYKKLMVANFTETTEARLAELKKLKTTPATK